MDRSSGGWTRAVSVVTLQRNRRREARGDEAHEARCADRVIPARLGDGEESEARDQQCCRQPAHQHGTRMRRSAWPGLRAALGAGVVEPAAQQQPEGARRARGKGSRHRPPQPRPRRRARRVMLPLAETLARKYRWSGEPLEDLLRECGGVWAPAGRARPSRGRPSRPGPARTDAAPAGPTRPSPMLACLTTAPCWKQSAWRCRSRRSGAESYRSCGPGVTGRRGAGTPRGRAAALGGGGLGGGHSTPPCQPGTHPAQECGGV